MSDVNNDELDPKLLEAMNEIDEEQEEDVSEDLEEPEQQQEAIPEEKVKAKKNGHLSREEYIAKYGNDNGYKSEEEFNRFGEIYPEIKEALKGINQKLSIREKELEASLKYIERVREREKENARKELQRALEEARSIGDVDAVQHLTREESKMQYQEAQEAAKTAVDNIHNVTKSFEERNPWYNKDQEMTLRAIKLDEEIRAGKYANIMPVPQTYEQLAHQIEILVKQEFGDRLRTRTEPMISNARSAVAKSTKDESSSIQFRNLDPELKSVYTATKRMMEKNGYTYTEQEFINKLKKDGEI